MNNLQRLRVNRGLTLEEFSFAIKKNCSRQFLSYLEQEGNMTKNMGLKIAEALNENIFYVMWTDVLKVMPKTKEDKEILLKAIESIEVE